MELVAYGLPRLNSASFSPVEGIKITSRVAGTYIFLPAAGCRYDNEQPVTECWYWSKTLFDGGGYTSAKMFFSDENTIWEITAADRYGGLSIRPVRQQ